jgi:ABC-type branched-subunit amino acid transport system ATPase component
VLPAYIEGKNTAHVLNVIFGCLAILVALAGGPPGMPVRLQRFVESKFGKAKATEVHKVTTALPVELRRPLPAVAAGEVAGLRVEDLSVSFGGLLAVDHVSLTAPIRRLTGLIGPNGAGKTTTFNSCSGLNRPTNGRVLLGGQDVSRVSPPGRARQGLGRTFQIMELCESLTVADNVSLGRESSQAGGRVFSQVFAPRGDILLRDLATAEALELCSISSLSDQQVGALSTGQRRLIELARCLAGPFDMLLLDEPSSGLDRRETEMLGDVLRHVIEERGCGVLLVEHDMSLVMEVCEKIYVLDFGRLIFEGTPAEVAASSEVRAAYLGSESLASSSTQERS